MQSLQHHGATSAPSASLEALRRRRIVARVGVSPALASTIAGLVFGIGQREDHAVLAVLTADRTGMGAAR